MRKILTLLIAISTQIVYSQTSSLVNDANFKAIIKKEGYSLVGSFITEKSVAPTPIAKAYHRGNWVLIDTKGKIIKEIKPQPIYGDTGYGYPGSDIGMEMPNIDGDGKYEQTSINGKYGTIHRKTGEKGIPAVYDGLAYLQGNIMRTKIDDKYGLANANGKIIAEPQFDHVTTTIFGYSKSRRYLIEVRKNEKKGLFSASGMLILPTDYERFEECVGCNDKNDLIKIRKDGKWGLAKMSGKILIEPKYQSFFNLTSKGLLSMEMLVNNEQKFGIMDTLGNELVPATLSSRPNFLFKLGLIKVNMGDEKNPKYGLLNLQGKQILKPLYEEINEEARQLLLVKQEGKYGIVNKTGAAIIKPTLNAIQVDEHKPYIYARLNNKEGIFDIAGKTILPTIYDELIIGDKSFIYKLNNEFGIINLAGKKTKTLDYDEITMNRIGILASKNEKYGIIDAEGKVLLPIKYSRIYNMRFIWEGIYTVRLDGITYMVDLYGNEVVAPN